MVSGGGASVVVSGGASVVVSGGASVVSGGGASVVVSGGSVSSVGGSVASVVVSGASVVVASVVVTVVDSFVVSDVFVVVAFGSSVVAAVLDSLRLGSDVSVAEVASAVVSEVLSSVVSEELSSVARAGSSEAAEGSTGFPSSSVSTASSLDPRVFIASISSSERPISDTIRSPSSSPAALPVSFFLNHVEVSKSATESSDGFRRTAFTSDIPIKPSTKAAPIVMIVIFLLMSLTIFPSPIFPSPCQNRHPQEVSNGKPYSSHKFLHNYLCILYYYEKEEKARFYFGIENNSLTLPLPS